MVEAHLALEKIYTGRGEYEKSLEQLRKVLQIDSASATAHYRIANIFRKMGRAREADKELEIFNQKKAGEPKTSPAPQRP
jgi:Tfp pilus assembly protein PilF